MNVTHNQRLQVIKVAIKKKSDDFYSLLKSRFLKLEAILQNHNILIMIRYISQNTS